jgi:transposase
MMSNQLSLFGGDSIEPGTAPERHLARARAKEELLKLFLGWQAEDKKLRRCEDVKERKEDLTSQLPNLSTSCVSRFLEAYNGEQFPGVFAELRRVSRSSLYNWLRAYREGGADALIPNYTAQVPKISGEEEETLRGVLDEKIKVSYSIFIVKYLLAKKGIHSPSSPATLRRWANRMKQNR